METQAAAASYFLKPTKGLYQRQIKTKQLTNKTCTDSESLTLSTVYVKNDLAEKLRELGI